MEKQTNEFVGLIVELLRDKKAENIMALDVAHMTVLCEAMVIASGRSALQVRALYESLDEKVAQLGREIRRREGVADGRWIVADFGDVIVHLFHEQEREYFGLERLWFDGNNRVFDNANTNGEGNVLDNK